MKELSIEEKAKRYDEALKVLHKYDGANIMFSQDLKEEMFPELKESEDERIRKALVEMVHDTTGDSLWIDYNVHKEEALAWLEKQGEQKPKFRVGDTIKCKYDDRQFTIKSVNLDKGTYTYTQEGCGNDIDYADEEFELAEQKPAEWSEEDELSCFESALFTAFSDAWQEYLNGEEVNVKQWAKEHSKEILEAAKEELKEQKTAWSEEDETTKNNISHIIRQYDKISKRENQPCYYVGDCLLWMQNIKERVVPQPKPEWSKEDEEIIHCLEYTVIHFYEDEDTINRCCGWLKSLRPQNRWKPSDEQIRALESIFAKHGAYNDDLLSLISDLKKLREE